MYRRELLSDRDAGYAHNLYVFMEGHGTSGNAVFCGKNEVKKRD